MKREIGFDGKHGLLIVSFVLLARYEKMISGMYMGEIVRLALEKLRKNNLIFHGKGSTELSTRGKFYTKYVSEIERYVRNVSCFNDLRYCILGRKYGTVHYCVFCL